MPKVNIQYLSSGEYKIVCKEEPEMPVEMLVAENLQSDVAVSLCNTQTQVVTLARQVDPLSFPAIIDAMLALAKKDGPPRLMVSFVGGLGQKGSPEGNRIDQYIFNIFSALQAYADPNNAHMSIASSDPDLPKVNIEGSRCSFGIMECEVLDRPHPESVYLVARAQQPDAYTARTLRAKEAES